MRIENPTAAPVASWEQFELAISRLHAAARSPIGVRDFYRQLLMEATDALGALGAAAWRRRPDGRPELVARSLSDAADSELLNAPAHAMLISTALAGADAAIHPARSASGGGKQQSAHHDCLLQPVAQPGIDEVAATPAGPVSLVERAEGRPSKHLRDHVALIELWLPVGASPPVRQGWLDFAAALAEVAADFHAWEELRRLRHSKAGRSQTLELLRRVQSPRDLKAAAFEAANEGRRLLGCHRLSVLMRRGGRWRLAAVSGVDRVARNTDFARLSERLALEVARWDEPVEYSTQPASRPAGDRDDGLGLPPRLEEAIEKHVDHSHARRLVAAPIAFSNYSETSGSLASGAMPGDGEYADPPKGVSRRRAKPDVVFLAERFEAAGDDAFRDQVVEIAELCGPALARATELDRFPLRTLLGWSHRLRALRRPARALRTLALLAAVGGAVAALVYVPYDFDVEAPATLVAAVERDVFATATGAVAEVRVTHGQSVDKGQTLIVLSDPELALRIQETRGEIDAARKRLDALAVTRTDRTLRENNDGDRLPLSAEQRELEERLDGLRLQLKLLEARRDDLVLKSPRAGQVLTRDVQSLLESRPVERGQVLLTIADASAGWELEARVPQRQVGHIVEAARGQAGPLSATYRLAGDVANSYPGHVAEISAAAPLDADRLEDDSAPVDVRLSLDGPPPAAARPGMTANVRIHCGRRSLGYVWLHDVGATLYRWFTF